MRVLAVLMIWAAFLSPSHAQTLEIATPMIREAPKAGGVTAGYLSITNTGETDDRLIAVRTDAAMTVEIHEMAMNDGVMLMREVAGGLDIPAGETVILAPRGLHLMIMNTLESLDKDMDVPVTLTFEAAGDVHVNFTVQPLGAILQAQ